MAECKVRDVYLKGYVTMKDVKAGLKEYCRFYNEERFHQGPVCQPGRLDDQAPDEVYFNQVTEK